jgi:hypothetical protein
MSHGPKCTFCGGSISASRDYRRVTGFERRRSGGGTNALSLRTVSHEWACEGCIRRMTRDRVNANQGALL